MSAMLRLTDDAIRAALTPASEVRVPAGLADGIRAGIDATPQRRPLFPAWRASRRTRLVVQAVGFALLLVALLGAILFVGSHLRPPGRPIVSTYHGGPERTGVMPGPGPAGDVRIEWTASVKGPMGPWSPVVVDGVVYVADQGGHVTALDEATGNVRWDRDVGAAINSGVTVADGVVLVGDDAGIIHGLDAKAGGSELWRHATGAPVHSAAAVVDGVAYVGSLDGRIYALDVVTGTSRWTVPADTGGPISRSIAVANGVIYAGSGGATKADPGTLGAFDTATGARRWTAQLAPGNTSTPSVADGRVYVTSGLDGGTKEDQRLYAFDARTGNLAWPEPVAAPSGATLLIAAVADGDVFVAATDGKLYVVDGPTGRLAWTAPIRSTLTPNGAVVGDVLYVTSDDRRIYAFDIATGREIWTFAIPGVPGSPAIVDGRIVVGTDLGKVVSLTGSAPASGQP